MHITIAELLKLIEREKGKPFVFCGHCGAIESYISDSETECPDCDNTGEERSRHKRL